jgi:gas vesicle protein
MSDDRIYYSHDAEMRALRTRTILTAIFLTAGLGIGAAIALLFAPMSGKKTRHDLAKNVEEGLRAGRDSLEPVVKRLEKEFTELRKSVEERMK